MKIAVVTQYYKPEDAKIPNGIAKGLADRGHDVRVVTGYPNYPEGQLYPGFRQRAFHLENDDQVEVRRVPLVISHSRNPFGRIANYVTFAISSLIAGRFIRDSDVVYVYATQMTAAFAPHVWSRTRGLPFVLHIQDLWPESVTGASMIQGGFAKKAIGLILTPWLGSVYRSASAVVAIAPTMEQLLVQRGVDVGKVHTVLNWADEDSLTTVNWRDEERTGLTVVYAGNLGHLQDLETVVAAAELVHDLQGFRIVFVGSGIAEGRLKAIAGGISNVEFRGRIPIKQMDEIYAESDFQLVTLLNLPIFHGTIPSKLQGSLAAGVPVISTVDGDTRRIIESAEVGLVSEPENAQALAEVFRLAYEMTAAERRTMGRRAKAYYDANMSMSSGIERIEQILASVARDPDSKIGTEC